MLEKVKRLLTEGLKQDKKWIAVASLGLVLVLFAAYMTFGEGSTEGFYFVSPEKSETEEALKKIEEIPTERLDSIRTAEKERELIVEPDSLVEVAPSEVFESDTAVVFAPVPDSVPFLPVE